MNDKEKETAEQLQLFAEIFRDKEAVINGRVYRLTKTTHSKRKKIFSFAQIMFSEASFLDSPRFEEIEALIQNLVLFEGELLSKKEDHWEKYPNDYMTFITNMIGAFSSPFIVGYLGD